MVDLFFELTTLYWWVEPTWSPLLQDATSITSMFDYQIASFSIAQASPLYLSNQATVWNSLIQSRRAERHRRWRARSVDRCRQVRHRTITLKARSGGTMWNWWVGRHPLQSSFIKNRALPPMNCSTKSIFKCCSCNCWSHHFNIFYQYQFRRCVSAGVQTKIRFPEYCFSYLRLGWWWACLQAISPMGRSCFVWRLWIKDTPTSMDRKSSCMWPSDQPHLGFQVVVSLGQVTKRQVKLQLSIASNESYQSHRSSRHLPPGNLT